jgi:regulatory protein
MPSKRITEKILSITKNKKGLYAIKCTTKSFLLNEDSYTNMPLYVGKELSNNEIIALEKEERIAPLYAFALSSLSRAPSSIANLRKKLQNKFPTSNDINEVIYSLTSNGLLDDLDYAKTYKEEKEAALYGKNKIINDLKFVKGISDEIINKLSFKDEKKYAKMAATNVAKKYKNLPTKQLKEKTVNSLLRRGFSMEAASLSTEGLLENKGLVLNHLNMDVQKALRHYGAKYQGYDLRNRVYYYLINKGYDVDDITKALKECTL